MLGLHFESLTLALMTQAEAFVREQPPVYVALLLGVLSIIAQAVVTTVTQKSGFRTARAEAAADKVELLAKMGTVEEAVAGKVGVPEYRAKTAELHGEINSINRKLAVAEAERKRDRKEIARLRAELKRAMSNRKGM